MEKHTAYFNLLERFKQPGCPICAQIKGGVKAFLDTYLYESVVDPRTWDRLMESQGYCGRHCRDLAKFSDGLAVALFYRHLLRKKAGSLGAKAAPKTRRLFGRLALLEESAPCPACRQEEEIESMQARLMRQALDEPEFHAAWMAHPGLCLAHVERVASEPFAARADFIRGEQAKVEALCQELDEIVRKSDHRNTEKMGTEADAWIRALTRMHGSHFE